MVTSSFAIRPAIARQPIAKSGHFYLAGTGHFHVAATHHCPISRHYVNQVGVPNCRSIVCSKCHSQLRLIALIKTEDIASDDWLN
jgi:hypothetical protein